MWFWWWIWLAAIFFFLFLPLSYGWSRRDWGVPYPTYYQRRRYRRETNGRLTPDPNGDVMIDSTVIAGTGPTGLARPQEWQGHSSQWAADLLWFGVLVWIIWLIALWV